MKKIYFWAVMVASIILLSSLYVESQPAPNNQYSGTYAIGCAKDGNYIVQCAILDTRSGEILKWVSNR